MKARFSRVLFALPLVALLGGVTLVFHGGDQQAQAAADCSIYYPDFCIPNPPPDLDCSQIAERNFRAIAPDPHGLDIDKDGIGCEDPSATPYPSKFKIRAYLLMLACDSCVLASPTIPATPTATTTAADTATPTKTPIQNTATPTPTAITPTSTPGGCTATSATVTGLNKSGSPESVTISGQGVMTGWYVISESGNQRFDFPAGYTLAGSVTVVSGSGAAANPPSVLLWTTANIWNNSSDDDAFLYDCQGTLKSTFDDGN